MRSRAGVVLLVLFGSLTCSDPASPPARPVVASVTVTPANPSIEILLDTLRLVATARDAQGTAITGRAVSWSSTPTGRVEVMPSGRVQGFQAGVATVTATIEGVQGSTTVTVVVSVASLQLTPASVSVTEGDTTRLVAVVIGTGGNTPSNGTVTWTSLDTATATVSSSGLVTTRLPGAARITASAGAKADTSTVTVTARVVSISVEPASGSVSMGRITQFRVTGTDARGDAVVLGPVLWTVSNFSVIAVIGGGPPDTTLTTLGLRPGGTTLIASLGGHADTASLTVLPVSYHAVAAGTFSSCGISTADSVAYCWGGIPAPIDTSFRFLSIAAGSFSTPAGCGIDLARTIICWSGPDAMRLPGPQTLNTVTVGLSHACGITTTTGGGALCWGGNARGQLGMGDTVARTDPGIVSGNLPFTAISAGAAHTCALTDIGSAYCWGGNGQGILGNNDTVAFSTVPVPVSGGHTFASISAGFNHTCALTSSGAAYCWGANSHGQLGTGDSTQRSMPDLVMGGLTFDTLSAGHDFTCGVTTTGAAYCWGTDDNVQLGNGTAGSQPTPSPVAGGLAFTAIAAADTHACGLTSSGVYCWGVGPLGAESPYTGSEVPFKVFGQP